MIYLIDTLECHTKEEPVSAEAILGGMVHIALLRSGYPEPRLSIYSTHRLFRGRASNVVTLNPVGSSLPASSVLLVRLLLRRGGGIIMEQAGRRTRKFKAHLHTSMVECIAGPQIFPQGPAD